MRVTKTYIVPLLLGFLGGACSNFVDLSTIAQADEKPDEPEINEVLRTRRLEIVANDGKTLGGMSARSYEHGYQVGFSMGMYQPESEDGSIPSKWEGIQMGYVWSNDPKDGNYEQLKKGASVNFEMTTNYLSSRLTLEPYRMGITTGTDGKSADWNSIELKPNSVAMSRNGVRNVELGSGSYEPSAYLTLRNGVMGQKVGISVPSAKNGPPSIEVFGEDDKLLAKLPKEKD
ncbi:MAG: hypothetical protein KDB68_00150 [Planctomycetes bacterium]|nr:hypothetical protein [Planctomycetota bacterium]